MRFSRISSDWLLGKILNGVSRFTLRKAVKSTIGDDARIKGETVFEQTLALYREIASSRGLDLNEIMEGSIKRQEGSFLYGLLIQHKPTVVLEVGTFVGFSTLIIAQALRSSGTGKVFSVDPWIGHRGITKPVEIALSAAEKSGVQDQIEFTRGWLSSGPNQPSSLHSGNIPIVAQGCVLVPKIAPLDFVYIDGDHSILNTVGDIAIALGFLRAGGVCVIHDVYSTPTVRRAIAELLLDEPISANFRFEVLEGSDGLGIFYKIGETVAVGIDIQDMESGNPIAGATVYAKGKTGIISTDANGNIYLPGIPAGDYHVTVKAEGYESIDDRFFHIDSGSRFQEVIVKMNRK